MIYQSSFSENSTVSPTRSTIFHMYNQFGFSLVLQIYDQVFTNLGQQIADKYTEIKVLVVVINVRG